MSMLPASRRKSYDTVRLGIISAGLVLQLISGRLVRKNRNSFVFTNDRINNVSFLFLQKGLVSEAKDIMQQAIIRVGAEPVFLSNYGLVLGLDGDETTAEKLFAMSEWWAISKHERAVISYNRALLDIHLNKVNDATDRLRSAFSLSEAEIARYCRLNDAVQSAMHKHGELYSLVNAHLHAKPKLMHRIARAFAAI